MGSSFRFERRVHRCLALSAHLAVAGMLLATTALCDDSAPALRQPAPSAPPKSHLGLELNKLEQRGEDCVIWAVLENRLDIGFESLKLDLVFFGNDGLIQRRFALDAAPLTATKTMVKVFKIPAMRCDVLGRILVNDVVACVGSNGPLDDCLERMRVSSLAEVELIK